MKSTNRFDTAISKLYNAFHNNQLNPECCLQCAVGNILDNKDQWKHMTDAHGSTTLNYVGKVNQAFGKRFNGYTPHELLTIEAKFLSGCGYQLPLFKNSKRPADSSSKEILFNGLSKAIEYLCQLDGIPNVMDYSKLFEHSQPVTTEKTELTF